MSEKKHAFSPESMNKDSKDKKKIKFKKRVKLLIKQYPNDLELGKAVRSLLNKVDKTKGEAKPKKVKLPKVDKSKVDNNENNYKETKKSKK
jgi:hypothetical protein